MKILFVDIETSPVVAYVWGTEMYKAYIGAEKIIEPTRMLCWAAKWYKEPEIFFADSQRGQKTMLQLLHKLMNQADVIVHFHGNKFDIPHINREFLEHDLVPTAPVKMIDLYAVVKRRFKFDNNSLKYLLDQLGLESKLSTGGLDLWKKVMNKDPEALKKMELYNKQDVYIMEDLYTKLIPWIERHPNHAAYEDVRCCPKCGSTRFQRRGYAISAVSRYFRYQCSECGGWFRGTKTIRVPGRDTTRNVTP